MTFMNKLKVTDKKRVVALDKTATRRENLIGKIEEQKAMLAAEVAGKQYVATKLVWITNNDGGKEQVEKSRRVRRWYWEDAGKVFVQLRYGARIIALEKGLSSIEANTRNEMLKVLDTCVEAAKAGEFDAAIEKLAAMRKRK